MLSYNLSHTTNSYTHHKKSVETWLDYFVTYMTIGIRFDYEDDLVPQPDAFTITTIKLPAIFGTGTFGSMTFGHTDHKITVITVS